jgi:DNA primase
MTVTPDGRHFKCFGCGESGDAASFVMKIRRMTFPEAVAYLTGGGPLP